MSSTLPVTRLFTAAALFALAACSDVGTTAPAQAPAYALTAGENATLAELRSVTARYHNLNAALEDGFIPVGECEEDDGAGGGIPYAHIGNLFDGVIDASRPDALLYEPGRDGRLRLVGVELAMPYDLWTSSDAPQFLGNTFRREDEMGVYGLHIWVWRHNPDGVFAWGNPNVSCEGGT
jgi:hypothetical protein